MLDFSMSDINYAAFDLVPESESNAKVNILQRSSDNGIRMSHQDS